MKKICIITTVPYSLYVLHKGLYSYFNSKGFEITCVAGQGEYYHKLIQQQGVKTVAMPLVRPPKPLKDLWSLIRLWFYFIWHRFDVVHVSTPKAGLLGTIAARLAGQKVIYTVRGRAYELMTGPKRKFYNCIERLSCKMANKVISVSPSLRDALIKENLCSKDKIICIGNGSSNGINSQYFRRNNFSQDQLNEFRSKFNIEKNKKVILFVGRFHVDKGITELVRAFIKLNPADFVLLLVGSKDIGKDLPDDVKENISNNPKIICTGQLDDPRIAYAASDIFVLPSYREGFPNAVLEAAAMELPAITTNAIGCVDSAVNESTGFIIPSQDTESLAKALQKLIDSPEPRLQMGQAGRKRVCEKFRQEIIWDGILGVYDELLTKK